VSELRAELCGNYGHPDILLHVDENLVHLSAWLLDYFAEQVASGVRFAADETIQVGWNLLKLAATPDGDLVIMEPDFKTVPIHWIEGASHTVRDVALQRAVCDDAGVRANFPSVRHAAYAPHQFPADGHFIMARGEPVGSHSGWAFHQRTDAGLHLISLYEAALANRAIIPFLALPSGAIVERDGDGLCVSVSGRRRTPSSSGLLARIVRGEMSNESGFSPVDHLTA
jgi:hypothetical protein